MESEEALLIAIQADPPGESARLAYANLLEQRGDYRGRFIRLQLTLRSLPPDHVDRDHAEHELSQLRLGIDRDWLGVVDPEWTARNTDPPRRGACSCLEPRGRDHVWPEVEFHREPQDTECDGWKTLLRLIEQVAAEERVEFAPLLEMEPRFWNQIVTLPSSISKLVTVKKLMLYGSHLVRIPPEIGSMMQLEDLTTYTSHRLHWFPYEITRCRNLQRTRVSTRALYGNFKTRPPFPKLMPWATNVDNAGEPSGLPIRARVSESLRKCSVCDRPFEDLGRHRVWISLRVGSDVLPLLVNACSEECVRQLPPPAASSVQRPHRGGLGVKQPPSL